MHSKKVIHNDIKPLNILLDGDDGDMNSSQEKEFGRNLIPDTLLPVVYLKLVWKE
jgi:serine/threonine protein kinase